MKKKKLIILSVAVLLLGVASVGSFHLIKMQGVQGHNHTATMYTCPMHPQYTSDKPGSCPICGMDLVPMEKPSAPESRQKVRFYQNPMNPEITSPVPMKDSMGMDYIPVYDTSAADDDRPQSTVAGRATVKINPEKQQLIGVKTVPVTRRHLQHTVQASGKVAYDPDLYNALNEYQAAVSAQKQSLSSPWPDVKERSIALVRAAALRLKQMGLAEAQIQELTQDPTSAQNLLLSQGGSVWVYAQVYESDISYIRSGQQVIIESAAYPGRQFRGVVKSIDPSLSTDTRSLKVRIKVPNADGALKLEMFVNIKIQAELGLRLAIPQDAVIDTGKRKLVYVTQDDGYFEPREVSLGRAANGFFEVLGGLSASENVVTAANFLVDSESRIMGARQ